MTVNGPTMEEINMLLTILSKAKHRTVADAMLKGFLWAAWPDWYEVYAKACQAPGGFVEVSP